MHACGIWLAGRRLIAVIVDDDGRPAPTLCAPMGDDERWALLEAIDAAHGLDWPLVLPEDLLRADSIGRLALSRGHELWSAPRQLIEAIRSVAGLANGARVAAMLARLAIVPGFRAHLRRVASATSDFRQLPLL